MKEFTLKEFETMLCATGYIPPRMEDELIFFQQMYQDYKSCIADRHVDIESIINGLCSISESSDNSNAQVSRRGYNMSKPIRSNRYSMVARNYENLPKDIIEKMRSQHETSKDE